VAVMLRGDVGTEVDLKFLETRKVKLTMERCVFLNDGTPSVGIRWKDGSSEMIVEGMMPGYQGFGECQFTVHPYICWSCSKQATERANARAYGHALIRSLAHSYISLTPFSMAGGTPKGGDRLLNIDGESIEHMPDDEIWAKLGGDQDSSVRLEFARGVAHHSVTLVRQRLSIVPTSASNAMGDDGSDTQKTITAAPITLARDLQMQANLDSTASPGKSASPTSSQGDYLAFQEQSPPPAFPALKEPLRLTAIKAQNEMPDARVSHAQPLQPFSPNKEMPCVIKTKSTGPTVPSETKLTAPTPPSGPIPRIGVNSRLALPRPEERHFHIPTQPNLQRALPPAPGCLADLLC
jgi:hypothetical protein